MKIAVNSTGTDLSATIDERFGRCRHFLLVETQDMSVEVIDNPHADLATGAGIRSASLVADAGANVVITGNCGPKAMQVFNASRLRIILGQHGVIRDVIEKFINGDLDASIGGNLPKPSGKAPPAATRPAWGSGRGGGGRGMGMGRRCVSAYGTAIYEK